MTKGTKKKLTTLALIGGLLLASYVTLKYVFALIWPFVLAYGIALLVHPVVNLLVVKLHFHKNAATILTLLVTILGIGVVMFYLISGLVEQTIRLVENWPVYEEKLISCMRNTCYIIERMFKMERGTLYAGVYDGATSAMVNWQRNVMPTIVNNSMKTLMTMLDILIVLVLTIMAVFYLTRDMDKYKKISSDNIFYKEIRYVRGLLSRIIKAYIRSQFIIMSVVAFICAVGLFIIGNDYYILLGIIFGILDALPLVGVGLVVIPWSFVYVFLGSYYKAGILFVVFIVCYFVREYLEPRLMGKQIGITPIASLVSMYIGYGLFGFLGMVAGPLVYVLIREVVEKYNTP